jgi:adenosine deaminase
MNDGSCSRSAMNPLSRRLQSAVRSATIVVALLCASFRAAASQTPGEAATDARLASLLGDSTRLLDFLRAMPKGGDLHNHLTGAIHPESWVHWAASDGYCFTIATATLTRPPCDAINRVPAARLETDSVLRAAAIDAWSMRGWHPASESGADHFFATFAKTSVVNLSHLGDMLAEVTSRAAAQHLSYLELMINLDDGFLPRLGARVGWNADFATMRTRLESAGLRDSIRNASRVFDIAEQRQRALLRCGTPAADAGCNVTVRYVYQAIRSRPPEQVFAQLLGGLEWPAIDRRYVSVNLVAPEHGDVAVRDFDLHMRMLDFLRPSYPSVPITLHAGELSSRVTGRETMRSHIRESIELGHAARIGHGVDVLQEDDAESLLREMAARHILVEIGLTSNDVILGVHGAAHPLATYLAHGVPVALVTDDEGVSLSDVTHEYYRAVTDQHLSYRTLKSMARNSIVYSFADESTKTRLRSELEADFARFERRWQRE